eukprot:TRINITY_DN30442_c0_g1_i1.p1 TRINITY_DN30442_c0_g1~~TRINITY_DN30442_c0_g1_i1.p1  ORF type:complete len:109 (+),score=15.42 TRINITY_DN30442_c0_g1_i1:31-327(+)
MWTSVVRETYEKGIPKSLAMNFNRFMSSKWVNQVFHIEQDMTLESVKYKTGDRPDGQFFFFFNKNAFAATFGEFKSGSKKEVKVMRGKEEVWTGTVKY